MNAEHNDGGSNAIRGFNYQKAVIALIAISNLEKTDFKLYIDNKDDAEFLHEGIHTFIQIKGMVLSIQKLVRSKDSSKNSILGKNLLNNAQNPRFKIITFDTFSENDKKRLIKSDSYLSLESTYVYCEDQKNKIIDGIKNEPSLSDEASLRLKIDKCFLVFSPFKNDLLSAKRYLIGLMAQTGIKVDERQGELTLNELFIQIDQKGEVKAEPSDANNQKKYIHSSYLQDLFKTSESFKFADSVWNEIKSKFNLPERIRIEQERLKVLTAYQNLKAKIRAKLPVIDLKLDMGQLFGSLYNQVEALHENKSVLVAVLVEIIAEEIAYDLERNK